MLAAGAPLGMHWIADRQSGPQILRHGSKEAKQRVLPAIAAGRCGVGIGMSEPDVGSDLASVRTRGTKVAGGWSISGTKLWTSHAHRVQYVIVLARTEAAGDDRHSGLTQFLVATDARGFSAHPIEDLTGGHDFNEIVLDEVFVSDDFMLGLPGDGWRLVTSELAHERSGPDRFLSTYPLFVELLRARNLRTSADASAKVGRLVAHLATLRRMSMAVAGMLDRGLAPIVEAAIVKDLGTSFEREIPEAARLLAPVAADISSMDPYVAELAGALLCAPSFTLRGGTREILRGIVARELGLR
jgi:alkylation response protein AidB-like acyl-CoA dehydrogenase